MNIDTQQETGREDKPLTRVEVERLLHEAGSSNTLKLIAVNLKQANLSSLNLAGANLSYADLSGANLSGANLEGADLSRADLSGANLSRASLRGTNLSGTDLRKTDLSRAILNGMPNFSRADLSGINLSGADLSGAILSGINLSGADLSGANLSDANLSRADLSGANLSKAILSRANLNAVNLSRANLIDADLNRADLDRANLIRAILNGADLRGANLDGAIFSGANLGGAILNEAQLGITRAKIVSDDLSGARDLIVSDDLSRARGLDESKVATIESATFRIRVVEKPLTPHNLTSILSAITDLATKCWLIGKGRLADLIEYTQNHDVRFVEESQLHFIRITYNSPFDASFRVDLSATNVAEGITTAIDGVLLAKQRLQKAELENWEKAQQIRQTLRKADQEDKQAQLEQERLELTIERERLEILEKRLEVQKKGIEYALEIAAKTVAVLHPTDDEQTKAMLIQTLLPTLLQLQNGRGLELVLPAPQSGGEKTETQQNG